MTRAAVVSVLMLALAPTGEAQQQTADRAPAPVFRSGAQLVPLNVTVTDGKRQFVRGLTADDFRILEDGIEQEVRFFEASEVPLDLILLIDTSSSMADRMDVVHEAAIGFLRTLRGGDRGAVVAFSDGVDIAQALTGDRGALEQAVRGTTARGATSLNNAIYIALKQFGQSSQSGGDVRRQAIAVLSDGEDTSSLVTFEDVLALARKTGVGIYPIALQSKYAAARLAATGQRRYFSESEYSLRMLAQETGAQAFFPMQIGELKKVYAAIAEELSSQYSIAYVPVNARADGRYRRIVVRVPGRPELRLRTRTGYTVEQLARPVSVSSIQEPESH